MSLSYTNQMIPLPLLFFIASWLATVGIHVAFAVGVLNDASNLGRKGVTTSLVSPAWWALATLFGGVLVAAIYWVIHHSALRQEPQGKEPGDDRSGID